MSMVKTHYYTFHTKDFACYELKQLHSTVNCFSDTNFCEQQMNRRKTRLHYTLEEEEALSWLLDEDDEDMEKSDEPPCSCPRLDDNVNLQPPENQQSNNSEELLNGNELYVFYCSFLF